MTTTPNQELPKSDGFYWMRAGEGQPWEVVKVSGEDFYYYGFDVFYPINPSDPYIWGPKIEEPK